MPFSEISIHDLTINPFDKFDREWALLTAGNERASNTMTVSWGGLGVLWHKNVATVYVRPSRYTKEFVDATGRFSLSFYAPEHKRALGVLGTKSGRDGNKVAEVGFTPVCLGQTVAFEQAELVLTCRALYADELKPGCFLDRSCDEDNYPEHDYHTMYIAEVEHVFVPAASAAPAE